MEVVKVFSDGETQMIPLPKDFQFKSREVVVERIRDVLILIPKQRDSADVAATLDLFTDDFMSDEIKDLPVKEREIL
ncbi:MAG: hypothetical protein IKZ53_08545 [Selenomonadaceae bacterium]|nr:hypothetical protein [Selenomonadaceae bacterium]